MCCDRVPVIFRSDSPCRCPISRPKRRGTRRIDRAQTTADRTRARLDLSRILEETVGDRARAQRAVEEAVTRDPGNADLAKMAEDIDDDRGQPQG